MPEPWYLYPIDATGQSYGQIQEPLDPSYLKPDVNVQVPDKLPITALGSGTVTSVQDLGYTHGGLSVVVKLDTPLNNLATHVAYNYLGSASVTPGQHINQGDQIALAGSSYGVYTALGLTSDDIWGGSTFSQNATGNPLLDPHLLLSPLRGTLPGQSGGELPGQSATSPQPSNAPIVGPLIDWLNQQKQGIANWFSAGIMRAVKMTIGIILIGLAIILLIAPSYEEAFEKAAKAAVQTAKAA